jgi:anaphase-promoting complex subunit 10
VYPIQAKPGNGVEQIRDDNVDTYWQSDGGQPHLINIQFHKKMSIVEVAFYLDYKLDESYTPKKLSIRAGTTFHDLVEIHVLELSEPTGWVSQ